MVTETQIQPTEDMFHFEPPDEEMIKFQQRMIYYSTDKPYNDQETQAIS